MPVQDATLTLQPGGLWCLFRGADRETFRAHRKSLSFICLSCLHRTPGSPSWCCAFNSTGQNEGKENTVVIVITSTTARKKKKKGLDYEHSRQPTRTTVTIVVKIYKVFPKYCFNIYAKILPENLNLGLFGREGTFCRKPTFLCSLSL